VNFKTAITAALIFFAIGILTGIAVSEPKVIVAEPVESLSNEQSETVNTEHSEEQPEEQTETAIEYEQPLKDTSEQASPTDRVKESQIFVYPHEVVINIENAVWSTFTDTNSMDPVLDAGANAIQIVPKSQTEIQVGDIISYDTHIGTVIHRVIAIGQDEEGWYAIAKGDNNPEPDPFKVRFEKIKRVVVAIIY